MEDEKAMSANPASRRPEAPAVATKIAELYRTPDGLCGCCLHCQLDDGNMEDWFFTDEIRAEIEPEHTRCFEIFDMLRAMRKTARLKASALAWRIRA